MNNWSFFVEPPLQEKLTEININLNIQQRSRKLCPPQAYTQPVGFEY